MLFLSKATLLTLTLLQTLTSEGWCEQFLKLSFLQQIFNHAEVSAEAHFFTMSSFSPPAWLAFTTVFSLISHIYFLREGSWTCCFCGWWKNRQLWPMNSDVRTFRYISAWPAHIRGLKKQHAIFHKDKSSLGKYSIISHVSHLMTPQVDLVINLGAQPAETGTSR